MQYNKLISILFPLVLFTIISGCGQGDSVTFNSSDEENALGQVTLAWIPPTTNADGTMPLNDLAGYKIYYGTSPGNYTVSIDVGNVATYTVTHLLSGATYYFTVIAYDTSGNASEHSSEVIK